MGPVSKGIAMIIGVPKEIKNNENRVALTPAGAEDLCAAGHTLFIERGAGTGSGFADETYTGYGAGILSDKRELFARAEMIMKVKEPLPQEYPLFQEGQIVFTYFHLAPVPELTQAMLKARIVGIAYETIQLNDGSLPLLVPMSEVAGRMSIQVGEYSLQKERGGISYIPSTKEYSSMYSLKEAHLKEARKDVIIMHPGPINRGVEISDEVADGPYSVILDQVENGVAVRMAVLFSLLGGES